MFKILENEELASEVKLFTIEAPRIAKRAKAGQFFVLRIDERGERIPLTLYKWNPTKGTISFIFKEVGVTTRRLGMMKEGNYILDVVGPLGLVPELKHYGAVAVIAGGVGIASAYPRIEALNSANNRIVTIYGVKTASELILVDEVKAISDELVICTDDGTEGLKGFTSQILEGLLDKGRELDLVFAVGPALMMRAVAEVTRGRNIKTIVSLNPIMVDGTGMCGTCRVSVGGETKFVCVDGPEFDAHEIDFNELLARLRTYYREEQLALNQLRVD
ncbi:MAG: sulfide/dihydroorotate dehydrogenase-like FAD/NAD-binding protein [Candidatus Hodarchaeota archaeon]